MSNFYKLNKDYIKTFELKVFSRYRDNDKRSETSFFKALLEEINDLFRKFGGKLSSKNKIPSANEYPDSKKYNQLINDIGFDIDKLYNAQKIIESDVNSLLNFNSIQRSKVFESLTTAQQEVYTAYIKSKRDVIGGTEVPADNPFISADNMSSESEDVYIDENRKILTLAFTSSYDKSIDIDNTVIYFAGKLPERPIYPEGSTLAPGSHWKKATNDPHFINTDNLSELETYKTMMIDDPNSNTGIGFCEFEAVRTNLYSLPSTSIRNELRATIVDNTPLFTPVFSRTRSESSSVTALREYIGQRYGKDPELIYADVVNSLQGKYAVTGLSVRVNTENNSVPKYKLVVPFTSRVLTNEIIIDFTANSDGYLPKINWCESKVFSRQGGADVAYSLIPPHETCLDKTPPEDGRYVIHITSFVYPTRMEIVIEYDTDSLMWIPIDFYMSYYVYSAEKTYEMPYYDTDSKLNIVLRKSYDIFVDAEANSTKERARALNVLKNSNRRG